MTSTSHRAHSTQALSCLPSKALYRLNSEQLPASLVGKQTCGKVNQFITPLSSAPFKIRKRSIALLSKIHAALK